MKVCNYCGIPQEKTQFHKCAKHKDGLSYKCKSCCREWAKQYRTDNVDKERERHAKYHADNKEKINARISAWQKNNRESSRERAKRFYLKNTEKELLRHKEWRKKNPKWTERYAKTYRQENSQMLRRQEAKRRAIKIKAYVSWADPGKILEYYRMARFLTHATGVRYEVDHIVPLQSNKVCGLHHEGNLQILTRKANNHKRNKFVPR